MAYESFRDELERKAEEMPRVWVHEVEDRGGKTLVEHVGGGGLIRGICGAYGLSVVGELDGDDAAEAGAEDGAKITVLAR